MKRNDIMRYIHSDWRRAHIDVRLIDNQNSLLRITTIVPGCRVMITFLTAEEYRMGFWENLVYSGHYPNWDVLFDALEQYLGMPAEDWHDYNEEQPSLENLAPTDINSAEVIDKVHRRHFDLPPGSTYTLPSVYWRQIEEYGDFDMEREFREGEDPAAD